MTNTCNKGHEWKPETTYSHRQVLKSGKVKFYPECSICVRERTPKGKKRTAIELASMSVVRDDWTEKVDCPRCHNPIRFDEDGDLKCFMGCSPRAHIQTTMIA